MRYINAVLMASLLYTPIGCTDRETTIDNIIYQQKIKDNDSEPVGEQNGSQTRQSQRKPISPEEEYNDIKERVIREMRARGHDYFDEESYEALREAERLLKIDSREVYRKFRATTQNSIRIEFEVETYLQVLSGLREKLDEYHESYTIQGKRRDIFSHKALEYEEGTEKKDLVDNRIRGIDSRMKFLEASARMVFGILKEIDKPNVDKISERYRSILQQTPDMGSLEMAKRHATGFISGLEKYLESKSEDDESVEFERQKLQDYKLGLEYIEQEIDSLHNDVEEEK